jgi:hypothetical protein
MVPTAHNDRDGDTSARSAHEPRRDEPPRDRRAKLAWRSAPMHALIDLEDKEAVRRALDGDESER